VFSIVVADHLECRVNRDIFIFEFLRNGLKFSLRIEANVEEFQFCQSIHDHNICALMALFRPVHLLLHKVFLVVSFVLEGFDEIDRCFI